MAWIDLIDKVQYKTKFLSEKQLSYLRHWVTTQTIGSIYGWHNGRRKTPLPPWCTKFSESLLSSEVIINKLGLLAGRQTLENDWNDKIIMILSLDNIRIDVVHDDVIMETLTNGLGILKIGFIKDRKVLIHGKYPILILSTG